MFHRPPALLKLSTFLLSTFHISLFTFYDFCPCFAGPDMRRRPCNFLPEKCLESLLKLAPPYIGLIIPSDQEKCEEPRDIMHGPRKGKIYQEEVEKQNVYD